MNTPPATATDPSIIGQIARSAEAFKLPCELVLAICTTESGLNPWAFRHEPAYRYLWDVKASRPAVVAPAIAAQRSPVPGFRSIAGESALTEWIGQQSSWGLMQVMGALARELGFRGHFPQLCFPTDGLTYGCRHLVDLKKAHFDTHGWAGVVSAYNCGQPTGDDEYVSRVASVSPAASRLLGKSA